ncbi:AraC family transcriptional regulator [uncultured Gemmiger sp.]|mgnify:FL=1|jgi:AraC-like DNA-binding protein/mannose-6-phosphate isomerase-like protein (cupin superfamily)|uniref:AraC family transcriptional regulator n=1 Tax=uncultured Gemmiger sp. TaxID=1623490 RepID=UPI0028046EE5|nr:AraC family transcriptional regulator [uncultured Gemmiger sp.]
MDNRSSLQETKHHGEVRFPFNIYPCTIPGDFRQVAVHWQDSMELIYIKRGSGLVQTGAQVCTAQSGDIFVLTPGTLHAIRQAESCTMEYENIIFDVELLGGAEDLCAEKYLLPLQSGRLALPEHITPDEVWYPQAADCLKEAEEANRCKQFGYELCIKGALLRFLALLIAQSKALPPAEKASTQRLRAVLQWISAHYSEPVCVADAAALCQCSPNHFMRWFRQMTGQTFIIFLREYRLNAAAEALRTTEDTILSISEQCGFENLSYFNREFKAHFGMTPREYRK